MLTDLMERLIDAVARLEQIVKGAEAQPPKPAPVVEDGPAVFGYVSVGDRPPMDWNGVEEVADLEAWLRQ
jgi:hypothetical protein